MNYLLLSILLICTITTTTLSQQQSEETRNDEQSLIDIPESILEKKAHDLLFGSPDTEIDFEGARKIYEQLAKNGNPEANLHLGFIHAAGLGVNPNQAKALLYYTFSAASDNIFAKMILAYRHLSGISVKYSCEIPLQYYKEVSKKVEEGFSFSSGHLVQRIRLNDEFENPSTYGSSIVDDDIIQWHQFLADKGDVQAQVGLGQLHFQGAKGVEKDHQKALEYFQKAANAGNANAMAYLGKIYLDGNSAVEQNLELAYEYFKKAADQQNAVGQSGLGLMYFQGKGVPQDYKKAFEYFKEAAKKNWVDGQLQLGIMYHKGLGVPKDLRKARDYFQLASHSGHVLGFYNLAQMYANGTGMARDCRLAVDLLKNVAERGHWADLFMRALQNYREGNPKGAFVKYAFLSELGYEAAQSNAAFILDREELASWFTIEGSFKRALNYWTRSASQGYVMALVKLGNYHYYGQGTEIDFEAAASHYRAASEQGNAEAFFNLGYMHEKGIGVRKDIHLAHRNYDLAIETSDEAQVPVALIKAKLKLFDFWTMIEPASLLEIVSEEWDIYAITILVVVIGILYFRR